MWNNTVMLVFRFNILKIHPWDGGSMLRDDNIDCSATGKRRSFRKSGSSF
jgi:hypothetical protein